MQGVAQRWFLRVKRQLLLDRSVAVFEDEIAEYLRGKGGSNEAVGAVSCLDVLWRTHAARAAARVLDGDSSSFVVIDQSLLAAVAAAIAQAEAADVVPGAVGSSMDRAALAWLHAEAVGAKQLAVALASRIGRFVSGVKVWGSPGLSPSTLVACWITGKSEEDLVAGDWPRLGGFRIALKPSVAPADFDELASLHCERAPRDVSFFDRSPLSLMPIELLVLEKRTGCRMEGKHPLINSPLAVRREVPTIAPHPQIAEVLQRAARELPGLERLVE